LKAISNLIYNNLLSTSKAIIKFKQGDHCGFSDSLNCPAAELICCGLSFQQETMTESQQMSLSLQYIKPWLDHFLKEKPAAWSQFIAIAHCVILKGNRKL